MPTDEQRAAYAAKFYKPKETSVEDKACSYAKACGVWHRKFKSASNRGLPDRIFITTSGDVFFIEFKRPGKSARVQQKLVIDEMADEYNAKVFVTDDVNVAKKIIDDMVTFGCYLG